MTENQNYARFVEWLWSKRTVNRDFVVGVLTETNSKDSSLPSPPLTHLESEDLFRYLEDKKLVFHKGQGLGECYSLNRAEPYRWIEVIDELRKPDWQRSWWFVAAKKSVVYLVSVAIAALLGAYAGFLAEKLVNPSIQSPEFRNDSERRSDASSDKPREDIKKGVNPME